MSVSELESRRARIAMIDIVLCMSDAIPKDKAVKRIEIEVELRGRRAEEKGKIACIHLHNSV